MLHYAVVFLVIALIAALFGFGGIAAGAAGIEASVGGSSSSSGVTKVRISPGTGFAYLLAKIDWDAKQKKNQTKIVDLDDDQWSFS